MNKNGENTLYIGPSITQFIKLAPQKEIEAQLNQNNATYKQHIAFVVNDSNGEFGFEEGSHWSLLVYTRDANAWYHMDLGGGANTPHAKTIIDKVNKYLISLGSLQNSRTDYRVAAHNNTMGMTADHS